VCKLIVMSEGILHIHKNRLHRRVNLLLLLIPPIVFVLIVTAVFAAYQTQYIASTGQISVLGESLP